MTNAFGYTNKHIIFTGIHDFCQHSWCSSSSDRHSVPHVLRSTMMATVWKIVRAFLHGLFVSGTQLIWLPSYFMAMLLLRPLTWSEITLPLYWRIEGLIHSQMTYMFAGWAAFPGHNSKWILVPYRNGVTNKCSAFNWWCFWSSCELKRPDNSHWHKDNILFMFWYEFILAHILDKWPECG
jgi:hypothetical protein